jgi:tRNA(fMet)-specific endonuclease VapC
VNHFFMLDTNTVGHVMKGKSRLARTKLASLRENQIACISVITEAELRYGAAKSKNPGLPVLLDWFLAKVQVLPWGRDEAIAYGELRAKQEALGKMLGNLDMLIAAHAIAVGATLVTADKGFANAPDLTRLVNWATDLTP